MGGLGPLFGLDTTPPPPRGPNNHSAWPLYLGPDNDDLWKTAFDGTFT